MNHHTYHQFHVHLQHWLATPTGANVFLILAVVLAALAIKKLARG